jgi:hypothetical protein
MIDAHRVEEFKHARESSHPPGESGLLMHRPLVLRMPPMLSVPAEAVRRIARHPPRLAAPVELEEFRMTPNIRAVMGDEDGQVANQPDAVAVGAFAQRPPLPVELEFDEAGRRFHAPIVGGRTHAEDSRASRRFPLGPGFPRSRALP